MAEKTNQINSVRIIDELIATDIDKALSANQGRILDETKVNKSELSVLSSPKEHDHDDRYANIAHNHDDIYELSDITILKESDIGVKVPNINHNHPDYSLSNHNHAGIYIPSSAVTKETLATNGDVETTITNTDDKFPTSGAVVDYVAANTSSGIWVIMPATPSRVNNTSFTVSGDCSAIFAKKTILKWTDTSVHCGMVVSSSYSSPNTTVMIIGDVLSATATMSSMKYCLHEATTINFAMAGTIGATGTDVANAYYADAPYRVLGADMTLGTAGTTNSTTVDINKGGITMFTVKPSCASTVPVDLGNTADDHASLALSDKVTIDIDAVQTTKAIDLYVKLFVFPIKFLSYS